jgi:hypothetical protein
MADWQIVGWDDEQKDPKSRVSRRRELCMRQRNLLGRGIESDGHAEQMSLVVWDGDTRWP